jgi:quinol monooxygenase YgiN
VVVPRVSAILVAYQDWLHHATKRINDLETALVAANASFTQPTLTLLPSLTVSTPSTHEWTQLQDTSRQLRGWLIENWYGIGNLSLQKSTPHLQAWLTTVKEMKGELRSMKGLLLNRRNFFT